MPPERKPPRRTAAAAEAQPAADVVCRRELTRSVGGRESTVSVSVMRPAPDGDHFACEFRIEGLGSRLDSADELPCVACARGVDAMQALLIAFQAVRLALGPHVSELAWLDQPGEHGIPLVVWFVEGDSSGFYAKIEAVVERESERFLEKYIKKERRARRTT